MNNEPKLNLDKPLQTRSGRKVLEHHVFQTEKNYPLVCLVEITDGLLRFNKSGCHTHELITYTMHGKKGVLESDDDLINVPEPAPVQFWDCPDDVPPRDVIWLRHKVYKSGCKRLLIGVDEKALEIDCMSINYEQLRDWLWLDNGVWKECVKG